METERQLRHSRHARIDRQEAPLGTMICTAAVMDDVIGLTMLSYLKVLSPGGVRIEEVRNATANVSTKHEPWGLTLAAPALGSLGSIVVGAILSVVLPPYLRAFSTKASKIFRARHVVLVTTISVATAFALASAAVGSSGKDSLYHTHMRACTHTHLNEHFF